MTAEIILKQPDLRVESNPQVTVCEVVLYESTEENLARLGFAYFSNPNILEKCQRAIS